MSTARPLAPLPGRERELVAANVAAVKQHMPELVDEIKALHELGLIEGWRAIECVTVGDPLPDPPGTVSGCDLVTETASQIKERMRNGNPR